MLGTFENVCTLKCISKLQINQINELQSIYLGDFDILNLHIIFNNFNLLNRAHHVPGLTIHLK